MSADEPRIGGIRRAMDLLQGTDGDALLSTMASMYALGGDTSRLSFTKSCCARPSNRQAMLSLARLAIQGVISMWHATGWRGT